MRVGVGWCRTIAAESPAQQELNFDAYGNKPNRSWPKPGPQARGSRVGAALARDGVRGLLFGVGVALEGLVGMAETVQGWLPHE